LLLLHPKPSCVSDSVDFHSHEIRLLKT
jgi:hypothetical protein